ncbi:hypothetical protein, partial [Mycobacterium marinum]|uniref:hypothetical protein n=1 Tax=Mycobacterium marinum TaxID=1781 RepID=UPI001CA5005E
TVNAYNEGVTTSRILGINNLHARHDVTYGVIEDSILCTEDNILYIAMLLGYDGIMVAYPEYLDIGLAKIIIAPDSRVTSAMIGMGDDNVFTAAPCQYVSGNFLQT